MSQQSAPTDPSRPIDVTPPSSSRVAGLTRRVFLRGMVGGGLLVAGGIAGRLWLPQPGSTSSPSTPPAPVPSPSSLRLADAAAPSPAASPSSPALPQFRSRPDLSSPLISMTAGAGHPSPGQFFLTLSATGTTIFDNSGSPLWIRSGAGKYDTNLCVQSYRGSPVLCWWEGTPYNGYGLGEYIMLDQTYAEIGRVKAGNGLQGDLHDFVITPEGTALFTVYSVLTGPASSPVGTQVMEGIIQEVDIASGRVVFEWRSSAHVALDESYAPPSLDKPYDYFHINSVGVDSDGNLLVSSRHTWTIYKIDRVTGKVIWRLGGRKSDFAMGPGARFAWQHDARRREDGSISLFDNGSDGGMPTTEDLSRGLVLDLDEAAHTATLRRAYTHKGVLANSQGNMQLLPDGNVLVGWGAQPRFTEYTADGTIVLDGALPDATFSYRAFHFDWHGRPAEPPAVVSVPSGDGTTVYVSWNGATDVATWTVLGGDTATSLSPLASHPVAGFETAIPVPVRPQYIAVRALDASGTTLAQSQPVKG